MKRFYKSAHKSKFKGYFEGTAKSLFAKPYSLARVLLLHTGVGIGKLLYIMSGIQELDYEEAQYWVWSRHLDIWYYSKPPIIAYLNWFSTWIFGVHEWSIRLNAVILSILTAIAVYYLVISLYNSARLAFYSSVLLLFFPGFVYISIYFTTDAPLVLFWVLSCLFFWKAIKEEESMKNWLFTALFVGLGLLSKYSLLFFYPMSFFYLWFYHKEILKEKGYHLFIFLSLLFLIPFVVWNIRHNWISIGHLAHLSGIVDASNSFSFQKIVSRQLEFLGGQMAFNLPILLLFILRKRYIPVKIISQEADRFLIFQAAIIFLMFFGFAFFRRVNINWLLFAYIPAYIVVARIFISQAFSKNIKIGFATITLLFAMFFFQPVLASLDSPLSKVIPGKVDPNKKLQGWSDLALIVQAKLDSLQADPPLIFAGSYRVASELTFYMKGNPNIFTLPNSSRKKHQFDLWELPKNSSQSKGKALLITVKPLEEYELESPVGNLVRKDSMTLYYKNQPIGTYYFYLFDDFYMLK